MPKALKFVTGQNLTVLTSDVSEISNSKVNVWMTVPLFGMGNGKQVMPW